MLQELWCCMNRRKWSRTVNLHEFMNLNLAEIMAMRNHRTKWSPAEYEKYLAHFIITNKIRGVQVKLGKVQLINLCWNIRLSGSGTNYRFPPTTSCAAHWMVLSPPYQTCVPSCNPGCPEKLQMPHTWRCSRPSLMDSQAVWSTDCQYCPWQGSWN